MGGGEDYIFELGWLFASALSAQLVGTSESVLRLWVGSLGRHGKSSLSQASPRTRRIIPKSVCWLVRGGAEPYIHTSHDIQHHVCFCVSTVRLVFLPTISLLVVNLKVPQFPPTDDPAPL